MEVTCPSETLESTYKFTHCHNPEDRNLNSHPKSSIRKFSAFREAWSLLQCSQEAPAGRGL
jgi:hypothetical protein